MRKNQQRTQSVEVTKELAGSEDPEIEEDEENSENELQLQLDLEENSK